MSTARDASFWNTAKHPHTASMATPRPGALEEGGAEKWTPGPWWYDGTIVVAGKSAEDEDAGYVATPGSPCYDTSLAGGLREERANGFLIAAAPTLFAALQELVSSVRIHEEVNGHAVAYLVNADMALAKARSGQ